MKSSGRWASDRRPRRLRSPWCSNGPSWCEAPHPPLASPPAGLEPYANGRTGGAGSGRSRAAPALGSGRRRLPADGRVGCGGGCPPRHHRLLPLLRRAGRRGPQQGALQPGWAGGPARYEHARTDGGSASTWMPPRKRWPGCGSTAGNSASSRTSLASRGTGRTAVRGDLGRSGLSGLRIDRLLHWLGVGRGRGGPG